VTLNARQKAFVLAYRKCGVAVEAYRRAGYTAKGNAAEVGASQLLRNPKVAAELAKLEKAAEKASIATVDELFEFWTATMRDEEVERKDRLKASELRAKAAGVFIERKELSGPGGAPVPVDANVTITRDEAIRIARRKGE
jgi:phage terminase small subunit